MDWLGITTSDFKSFVLIAIRVSAVLSMLPVFGSVMVPNIAKACLAISISGLLLPVVRPNPNLFPDGLLGLTILIVSELLFGMVQGMAIRLFLTAAQMAGSLIGFQAGFTMARAIDPDAGTQGDVLAQLAFWVATLLFITVDGHHVLLRALAQSFATVKVGGQRINIATTDALLRMVSDMFVVGIKIGAPAIGMLLLITAAFGIFARVVPQMNILVVAMPLKIVVGLLFFGVSLEALLFFMKQYVFRLPGVLTRLASLMGV